MRNGMQQTLPRLETRLIAAVEGAGTPSNHTHIARHVNLSNLVCSGKLCVTMKHDNVTNVASTRSRHSPR